MHKTRLILSASALLLVVGTGEAGAAERPYPTPAFGTAEGQVQYAAMSGNITGADPGSLATGIGEGSGLPGPPRLTLNASPAMEVAQGAGGTGTAPAASTTEPETEGTKLSATEANKQLSNPVSSFWSLSLQSNNYYLTNRRWNENLQFQPVLPVSLTKEWNLITRPVFQLYNNVPAQVARGQYSQQLEFGDTILLEMLSPNAGPWLLGAGPTFVFPTATSRSAGQGQWQAGPAAVVGYLGKNFIVGAFPQQWWSITGDSGRACTSQLNLQPFAAIFFGEGWNVGYSGNILANWRAPISKDVWTVPLGLGIGKVVKLGPLPVKFQLAGQWMAVHPYHAGQEWNIQLQIAPVIPKLIKGVLFD